MTELIHGGIVGTEGEVRQKRVSHEKNGWGCGTQNHTLRGKPVSCLTTRILTRARKTEEKARRQAKPNQTKGKAESKEDGEERMAY